MEFPLPRRLDELRRRVARLDAELRPVARRAIEANEPGWLKSLSRGSHPVPDAKMRAEAEACLQALIDFYSAASEESRTSVRELLAHYSAFAWAAALPLRPGDPQSIREQLIHFSMVDQGLDPRDAMLWLDELCSRCGLSGLDLAIVRYEVAEMSSTADRYGFGSTASLLREGSGPGVA